MHDDDMGGEDVDGYIADGILGGNSATLLNDTLLEGCRYVCKSDATNESARRKVSRFLEQNHELHVHEVPCVYSRPPSAEPSKLYEPLIR